MISRWKQKNPLAKTRQARLRVYTVEQLLADTVNVTQMKWQIDSARYGLLEMHAGEAAGTAFWSAFIRFKCEPNNH